MTRTMLTTQLFAAAALLLVTVGTLPAAAQTFDAAVEAYERGDYATALAGLQNYAEQGSAAAQFNLGPPARVPRTTPRRCTPRRSTAKGVPKDDAEAMRWYRLAAEQGALAQGSTSGSCTPAARVCPRTTPRRCGGTASPPRRATPSRSSTSGSCTPAARVCPRTTPRRCGGTASPPSRATPARSPSSGSCTPAARVCPRTTPRRCGGSASPPRRATPARSPSQRQGSGSCTPAARVCPRTTPRRCGGTASPPSRATPPQQGSCTPTAPKDDAEAVRWYRLAAEQGNAPGTPTAGCAQGRRRGGAVVPPRRRAGQRPRAEACTPAARVCPRTTPRRCGGSASPPSRATPRAVHPRGHVRQRQGCAQGRRRGDAVVPPRRRAGQRRRAVQGRRRGGPRGHVRQRQGCAQGRRRGGAVVPPRRRAGQRRRAVQPRGHVRQRRGCAQGRRRGGAVVPPRRRAGQRPRAVNLGVMYASGKGVPKDDAEAVRWYRLAAEQGNALAQVAATGEGVPERRRCGGTASPPSRATPARRTSASGSCTPGQGCARG